MTVVKAVYDVIKKIKHLINSNDDDPKDINVLNVVFFLYEM